MGGSDCDQLAASETEPASVGERMGLQSKSQFTIVRVRGARCVCVACTMAVMVCLRCLVAVAKEYLKMLKSQGSTVHQVAITEATTRFVQLNSKDFKLDKLAKTYRRILGVCG